MGPTKPCPCPQGATRCPGLGFSPWDGHVLLPQAAPGPQRATSSCGTHSLWNNTTQLAFSSPNILLKLTQKPTANNLPSLPPASWEPPQHWLWPSAWGFWLQLWQAGMIPSGPQTSGAVFSTVPHPAAPQHLSVPSWLMKPPLCLVRGAKDLSPSEGTVSCFFPQTLETLSWVHKINYTFRSGAPNTTISPLSQTWLKLLAPGLTSSWVTAPEELLMWQQDTAPPASLMVALPSPPPSAAEVPCQVLREKVRLVGSGKITQVTVFGGKDSNTQQPSGLHLSSGQTPVLPQGGRAALPAPPPVGICS